MRLQIISDVHLEFRNGRYPYIPVKAPHIALVGDIGRPFSPVFERFIRDLSRRFDTVLFVAGNHEYHSPSVKKMSVGQIADRIKEVIGKFPNAHFLDRTCLFLDGVRILGATLWTHVPREAWGLGKKRVNDYRTAYLETYPGIDVGVPLGPDHTSRWHEQTVHWLKEELRAPGYENVPTVVLTHHAPYNKGVSDGKYEGSALQCFYSTDLSCMFAPPLVAWAWGHTHYRADFTVQGVRLVSNPLGYPGELETEEDCIRSPTIIHVPASAKTVSAPPGLRKT